MSLALITGATSGFGKATALKFAASGYNLIVTGRRKERLDELTTELQSKGVNVLPLAFDVRDRKSVDEKIAELNGRWKKIDLLVNNAGLALGRDFFDEANMDDWETMIDTNLKGLIYMSRAVIPFMKEQGRGQIINVGSIAGKQVYEKGNFYCATKHAVDALSKAMRVDLLRHKIKVTAIHPGAAETEFSLVRFKGDEAAASSVYEGYEPLKADDIADIIYYCATLPAHVCINEINVTPTAQADAFYFFKE